MSSRLLFLTLATTLSVLAEASLLHTVAHARTTTIALTGDTISGGNGVLSRLGDPVLQ